MALKDRVVLVTGAGRGIGATTAKMFAEAGAQVVCADINVDFVDEVVEELKTADLKASAAQVDVAHKDQVATLVGQILKKYDRLDILINNAGITRDALAMKMSEEHWDSVVQVNLKGTWIPCQAVIRPMRKNRWGRIINTASIAARGNPGQANYSATKGAVISLTRTLALELATSGITVNCVAPGAIMTPMLEKVPEKTREVFINRIPVKRFGTPEDIASTHLFLCSEGAAYITGQVIPVDGGMSIGM